MMIYGNAVLSPKAIVFQAMRYPLRPEALDVSFCLLDRPDDIRFFQPIRAYPHTLRHLPYLIEIHFFPPSFQFSPYLPASSSPSVRGVGHVSAHAPWRGFLSSMVTVSLSISGDPICIRHFADSMRRHSSKWDLLRN